MQPLKTYFYCLKIQPLKIQPLKIRSNWQLIGLFWYLATTLSVGQDLVIQRHPQAVPRAECFAVESLKAEDRVVAEKTLLSLLDDEALYTLIDGIKPVSEGYWSGWLSTDQPDLEQLNQMRRVLKTFRCGEQFAADVLVFENLQKDQRHMSAWIADLPRLRDTVAAKPEFFGRLGLNSDSNPSELMLSIERSQQPDERWRGLGLLFGYPEFAIDFFVAAGLHQRETGEFVERDFRQYPVFSAATGGFVYAVPKLFPEQDSEKKLRDKVQAILDDYRPRRESCIGDGKPGVVELVRDWFDDGSGWCHPNHAAQKNALHPKSPVQQTSNK